MGSGEPTADLKTKAEICSPGPAAGTDGTETSICRIRREGRGFLTHRGNADCGRSHSACGGNRWLKGILESLELLEGINGFQIEPLKVQ